MLKKLCERHDTWLKYAYHICSNKTYAEDLVQDMYVKLSECTKEVNDSYVWLTLRSLHLNDLKKNKEIPVDVHYNLVDKPTNQDREEINECLNQLTYVQREVLLGVSESKSAREFSREININHSTIHRIKKEALKELKHIYNERNTTKR